MDEEQKMNMKGYIHMNQNDTSPDDSESEVEIDLIEQDAFDNDESESEVEIISDEEYEPEPNPLPEKAEKPKKPKENKNNKQKVKQNNMDRTLFKNINYEKCSNNKILEIFNLLQKKWIFENNLNIMDILKRYCQNLIPDDDSDMDILNKNYNDCLFEIHLMRVCLEERKLIDREIIDDPYTLSLKKIIESIHYGRKVLSGLINGKRVADPTYDGLSNMDETFDKYTPEDLSKCHEFELLLRFFWTQLSDEKCARYQNFVCQQKYVNGFATHYWEKKWEIKDFVQSHAGPHTNGDMFHILTKAGNYNRIVEFLTERMCGGYFNDVKRTIGVWAFRNGLYHNRHKTKDGEIIWKFYEYGGKEVIPNNLIASVYYDVDFTAHEHTPDNSVENWRDIPTPFLDQIAKFQFKMYGEDADDIYDILMIMIGRLPSKVGEFDKWEVFLFLVGLAGCGKSMILLNVIGKMFDDIDIGHLENDTEPRFGFSPHKDKAIILATEIAKSFNMSAQLFQKFVSGEHVTLPVKGKDPIQMVWDKHIAFGGNELFNLADKAGAIARRLILINFHTPVPEHMKNTKMPYLLDENIGNIIHKVTCAYLEKLKKVGTDSIWNHMPKYFLEKRDEVMSETNAFYSFITSEEVELHEDYFCEIHEFKMNYNLYLRQNNMDDKGHFGKDVYIGPFAKLSGIKGFTIGVRNSITKRHYDKDGKLIEDERPRDYIVGLRMRQT